MPVYDYRCLKCDTLYDVFHKSREVVEDVVCPSCNSTQYRKLMSIPSITVSSGSAHSSSERAPSCGSGDCCGGMCEN